MIYFRKLFSLLLINLLLPVQLFLSVHEATAQQPPSGTDINNFHTLEQGLASGGVLNILDDIVYEYGGSMTVSTAAVINGGGHILDGAEKGMNIVFSGDYNRELRDISVIHSTASSGGAVYNGNSSSLSIFSSTFTHNISSGTLYSYGGAVYNSSDIYIQDSYFGNNTGSGFYTDRSFISGGAMANVIGSARLVNVAFENNTTIMDGGAIMNTGFLEIRNSTFTGNSAAGKGGALYNEGNVILHGNNYFYGNSAEYGAGVYNNGIMEAGDGKSIFKDSIEGGGSFFVSGADVIVENSVFSQNSLDISSGSFSVSADSFTVTGNITNNGSIYFSTSSMADIRNSISGSGTVYAGSGSVAAGINMEQERLEFYGEGISFINEGTVSAEISLPENSYLLYSAGNTGDVSGGGLNLKGESSNSGTIAQSTVSVAETAMFNNYGTVSADYFINSGTVNGGNINVFSSFLNSGNSVINGSTVTINGGAFMRAEDGSGLSLINNYGDIYLNAATNGILLAGDITGNGAVHINGIISEGNNEETFYGTVEASGIFSGQTVTVSSAVLKVSDGVFADSSLILEDEGVLSVENGQLDSVTISSFTVSGAAGIKFDSSFVSGLAFSDVVNVTDSIDGGDILSIDAVNIINDDWMEVTSTSSFRLFSSSPENLAALSISTASAASPFGEYEFSQDENDRGLINVVKTGTGKSLEEAFGIAAIDSYSMREDSVFSSSVSYEGSGRKLVIYGNGASIDGGGNSAINTNIRQSLYFYNIGEIRNFSTLLSSDTAEGAAGFLVNAGSAGIYGGVIKNNENTGYGGGAIYNKDSGILSIENVYFENNTLHPEVGASAELLDIYNSGLLYVSSTVFAGGVRGSGVMIVKAGDVITGTEGIIQQSTVTVMSGAVLTVGAGRIVTADVIDNNGVINLTHGNGMIEEDRILVSPVTGTGSLIFTDSITSDKPIIQSSVTVAAGRTVIANSFINASIDNRGTLDYRADELPEGASVSGSGILRIQADTVNHATISQESLVINQKAVDGVLVPALKASFETDPGLVHVTDSIKNSGTLVFTSAGDGNFLPAAVNNNTITDPEESRTGMLVINSPLENHGIIVQERLQINSGLLNSDASITADEVIFGASSVSGRHGSGSLSLEGSAVFTVTDRYDNAFNIPEGYSLSLKDNAVFNKNAGSFTVSGGSASLRDSSALNAVNIIFGGGESLVADNASVHASGRISIGGGMLELAGHSQLSAAQGIFLNGGIMHVSGSASVSTLETSGGILRLSSALSSSGISVRRGSTVETEVMSSVSYGSINTLSAAVANEETWLVASVKNDFLDKGESVDLNIISSAMQINGDFAGLRTTPGYELESKGDGVYKLTYMASVSGAVRRGGGDDNNVRSGDAWMNYSPVAGSTGEKIKEALNEAYYSDPSQYVEMLSAIAPESTPAAETAATGVNSAIYDVLSSRLTSLEGMASGDVFSNSGVWGHMLYSRSVFSGGHGFNADSFGAAAGADAEIFDGTARAGAGYSYASTAIDSFMRDTDIKTNTFFVYGQYVSEYISYRGMISYGRAAYEETAVSGNISGINNYNAGIFGISAEAEYCPEYLDLGDYEWLKNFTPSVGLRYTAFNREAYEDAFSQRTGAYSSDALSALLEFSWKNEYHASGNIFRPELHAGFSFDVISPDGSVTVTMPDGISYQTAVEKMPRASFEIGGAAGILMDTGSEIGLAYNGSFRSGNTTHSVMVTGRIRF